MPRNMALALFFKAHIQGYARKDGTFVAPHEDSRAPARWHGDERHVEEIMALVRQSPHKSHALRVMTPSPDVWDGPDVRAGDALPPSYVWKDGEPTARKLRGTPGIGFHNPETLRRAILGVGPYFGRQVVLIGGPSAMAGYDAGEKRIADARILAVWARKGPGVGRSTGLSYGRAIPNPDHSDHD